MIGEAIRNYHRAVEENLLELGHPVSVQDTYNVDVRGITLGIMSDNRVVTGVFDQIRCCRNDNIEVHCTSWDYGKTDEWVHLSALGEAGDYVLEAIQWIDRDKLMEVDGGVWSGTANEVYSFCSSEIALYFIHENGLIEDLLWHESIDDFIGIRGVFAVEKRLPGKGSRFSGGKPPVFPKRKMVMQYFTIYVASIAFQLYWPHLITNHFNHFI